jgi:hypothetical protein
MRILLLLLVACGGKAAEPTKETGSATTPAPVDAGVVAKVPEKPAKQKVQPSKAQLAELKKRMKAGWALQKANKWAEAIPEFEAALAAVADEQRALAELGWSAMHAGDFAKARKMTEQAIRVAADKNVKASVLFNLGQIQEKTSDRDGALKSYVASLKLRPNAIVEKALAALGAKPDVEPPFCAAGAKPCDCILEHAFDENQRGTAAKCVEATSPAIPVKTFKRFTVSSEAYFGSKWTYVLDEANQLVAVVEGEAERGRLFEKTALEKAELKTIGKRWVLWIETTYKSDVAVPTEEDAMITEEHTSRQLTICVVGDAKTPTRCPLSGVPLLQKTDKGMIDTPLKTTSETHVDVTLADDGTATVKLVKGPSDAQIGKLVGPHKLW